MIKFICSKCGKEWYSSWEGNLKCNECGGDLLICKDISSIKADNMERIITKVGK